MQSGLYSGKVVIPREGDELDVNFKEYPSSFPQRRVPPCCRGARTTAMKEGCNLQVQSCDVPSDSGLVDLLTASAMIMGDFDYNIRFWKAYFLNNGSVGYSPRSPAALLSMNISVSFLAMLSSMTGVIRHLSQANYSAGSAFQPGRPSTPSYSIRPVSRDHLSSRNYTRRQCCNRRLRPRGQSGAGACRVRARHNPSAPDKRMPKSSTRGQLKCLGRRYRCLLAHGIDSLVAVELRYWLSGAANAKISIFG